MSNNGSECLLVGSTVYPQRCECQCDCCRGACDVDNEHDLDDEHSVASCPDSREFVYARRKTAAFRHQ